MTEKGKEGSKRKTKKHWYFITIIYCPLCGHSIEYRERRYGAKPRAESKRGQFIEDWDGCGI